MNDVLVLVSAARHPVTGAAQRHLPDARALELALRLQGLSTAALHLGRSDEPALAFYAGMGPACLHLCPVDEGTDLLPAAADCVRRLRPRLVLAGSRSPRAQAQGLLAFALAAELGWPVLSQVCEVDPDGPGFRVVCAPRLDLRDEYRLDGPAVLVAGEHAPDPRPFAAGRARRTPRNQLAPPQACAGDAAGQWQPVPARPLARRLRRFEAGASDADKLAALMAAGRPRTTAQVFAADAQDGARLLLGHLREHGFLPPT